MVLDTFPCNSDCMYYTGYQSYHENIVLQTLHSKLYGRFLISMYLRDYHCPQQCLQSFQNSTSSATAFSCVRRQTFTSRSRMQMSMKCNHKELNPKPPLTSIRSFYVRNSASLYKMGQKLYIMLSYTIHWSQFCSQHCASNYL